MSRFRTQGLDRWRMVARASMVAAIGVACITAAAMAGTVSPNDSTRTETLWRGLVGPDSLFVRATCIPTTRSNRCGASMGESFDDSDEVHPKYLDYRIEDSRGRVRFRDQVSGADFGVCVDGLGTKSDAWESGFVLTVTVTGWGCEPTGDCELFRYVYLRRPGHYAASEWTALAWNPSSQALLDGSADDGCISYSMTLRPMLQDSLIRFVPAFGPDVALGAMIERPVDEDTPYRCKRQVAGVGDVAVDWYSGAQSDSATRRVIRPLDSVEIESVVARAVRSPNGGLKPLVVRVGVTLNGQKGFVPRAIMTRLGFPFM